MFYSTDSNFNVGSDVDETSHDKSYDTDSSGAGDSG